MGNQLGAVGSGKFHRERDMRQAADLAHALTEAGETRGRTTRRGGLG